ncbi:MAG: hypothetical protein GXC72_14615, partial [Chitinophagaceae bacterium]|nr:hypothetical protein [Chitinophagaceae bacterium]
ISYTICFAQLLIYQNKYPEALDLLEAARQQNNDNLSLLYLLIKTCRGLRDKTKERILIIEFLKLNNYDYEIRLSFERLVFSNCQFTEEEYLEIETLFKKLIFENNRNDDKIILIAVYKKWFQKKFHLLLKQNRAKPNHFVFTLQLLTNAKELAKKNNELEQGFRKLEDIEKDALQTYRKFIRRFSS